MMNNDQQIAGMYGEKATGRTALARQAYPANMICRAVHNAKQVDWTPGEEGCFASDLARTGSEFAQIYSDACDVGFALMNAKTGNITYWYISEEIPNGDEVGGWKMRACPETAKRFPATANITLTIWND